MPQWQENTWGLSLEVFKNRMSDPNIALEYAEGLAHFQYFLLRPFQHNDNFYYYDWWTDQLLDSLDNY